MAVLIAEREWEKDFQISGGRIITLRLQDDWSEISFWENGEQLGSSGDQVFNFIEHEVIDGKYLLARMYCPVKNEGLGREAILMFIEYTGGTIYTRPPLTGELDDGSHLTEDAPGFVMRMQDEELIEQWNLE